jgi:4,5-DOPA dioxygenase extradiol
MKMPVLFVGHGAPTNALENNPATKTWEKLGRDLPRPEAVLCVSAHWITPGTQVLASVKPKTIHDFQGFPQEMYQVQYPAPGAPKLAGELAGELKIPASEDWGLDHGTWSVLKHLYPKADVPVLQLSLDQGKTFGEHLELGRRLQPFREKGVLILGSGNLTHNLRQIVWDHDAKPVDWALEFDGKAQAALQERDEVFLTDPGAWGKGLFRQAHPTADHYVPLLYALGASTEGDRLTYPYEGFEYGTLSMRMVLYQ